MIRPPFVARVAAGLAVTAMEEAKKLPTTAVALPMTAVSQMLQTSMRVQQSITSLAIKGDQAFALINWSSEDEQPEWAVFDEDVDAPADPTSSTGSTTADTPPTNAGRFALYSLEPTAPIEEPAPVAESESTAATTDGPAEEPEIVTELDYPQPHTRTAPCAHPDAQHRRADRSPGLRECDARPGTVPDHAHQPHHHSQGKVTSATPPPLHRSDRPAPAALSSRGRSARFPPRSPAGSIGSAASGSKARSPRSMHAPPAPERPFSSCVIRRQTCRCRSRAHRSCCTTPPRCR